MVETLSCPLCFGATEDRRKCLQSIQRLRDADFPDLADDPLWQHRHRLTLQTGGKHSSDIAIYEEAVAEYLKQGKGVHAVRLRILIGELMGRETISFRERYAYTLERHIELLRAELEQAGLHERTTALVG